MQHIPIRAAYFTSLILGVSVRFLIFHMNRLVSHVPMTPRFAVSGGCDNVGQRLSYFSPADSEAIQPLMAARSAADSRASGCIE